MIGVLIALTGLIVFGILTAIRIGMLEDRVKKLENNEIE